MEESNKLRTAVESRRRHRAIFVVGAALVISHLLSACFYAARYNRIVPIDGLKSPVLDTSQDEWARVIDGMDAASYLRVAQNVAAGRGVTLRGTQGGVVRDLPFCYWGPGAPVAFGAWLWLVGGSTMWTFFWFSVFAQFLFGLIAIATARLWTNNLVALVLVAVCSAVCPPMRDAWSATGLTSSEIVALVPLALVFYALARGCLVLHQRTAGIRRWQWFKRIGVWFLAAGMMIGVYSLVRDPGVVLATFVALFLVVRSLVLDRSSLRSAIGAAALLAIGTIAVRLPVERWNLRRMGHAVVCTSSAGCIWRYGLWMPHDKNPWFDASGIGLGEYLDPAAAQRVEQYYRDGKPRPALYSLGQLTRAVWNRPWDAIAFRLSRAPILWLAAGRPWPNIQYGLDFFWCLAFYVLLALFCLIHKRKRRQIPEVLYLFPALLICAAPLVHCEFRYSLPVWNTLVMAPGLLVATLAADGWLVDKKNTPTNGATLPAVGVVYTPPIAA